MKYTERRTLYATDLRAACVNNDWYTNGTNAEYDTLFSKLRDADGKYADMTTEKLAEIATDIYTHSERENAEEITYIMFVLARACVSHFTEV